MKISSIKIEGFRGVKNSVELSFSPGFVIVTGRNGSGKSTLCDAIEYALTGSIRKYGERKEKQESVEDYIWWRGKGVTAEKRIELGFSGGEENLNLYRDTSGELESAGDISVLYNKRMAPRNPLENLCKTTILRDEQISEFSLDLPETERYNLVKSAIGTYDLSNVEKKANDATRILND